MSKKPAIITSIFSFLLNLAILLTCVFISFNITNKEAKETLVYYADSISLVYKGEESNDEIKLTYGEIYNIRISIFNKEDASILLDINPLDEEVANENRLNELNTYSNNFYTKVSLTTNYETLYYVKLSDNYFIRVGLPTSSINKVTKNIIIYGLLTLITVETIFCLIQYLIYKKKVKKIQTSINELEDVYGGKTDLENADGVEIINSVLQKVKVNYESYVNDLKNEKIKNELILNSLNEGFILLDEKKNVILINKFALDELGLIKEVIINKSYLYLGLGNEVNKLIEEEAPNEKRFDFEYKNKIYFAMIEKFLINNDCNYFNYGIAFVDVTETRISEKIRKNFVENASHELKTPLTTILGYESLINSNLIDGEELRNANVIIEKESLRMKKLIEDMLTLSEIEASSKKENYEEINVKENVESIVNSLDFSIKEKHLNLNINLEDVRLKIDPEDFDVMFRNLLTNAIKYNKENGAINVTLNNKYLLVEDTGIGIKEKDKGRIFERFYRVDKSRSNENGSTGLGLSIVKHIALKYKFNIEVDSTPCVGSSFKVNF